MKSETTILMRPNPARALAVILAYSGEQVDEESVERAADYCEEQVEDSG